MVSQEALAEAMSMHRTTIFRCINYLKEKKAVAIVTSGSTNIYAVNAQIAWKANANGKNFALFDAAVYSAESEQEGPLFSANLVAHVVKKPLDRLNPYALKSRMMSHGPEVVCSSTIFIRSLCVLVFILLSLRPSFVAAQCDTKTVELFLLNGFKKDQVKVVVDGKLLFSEVITTDESIGVADHLSLKRVAYKRKVSLLVNGILLHMIWLDPTQGCVYGYGFSKDGYFIANSIFWKAPIFD